MLLIFISILIQIITSIWAFYTLYRKPLDIGSILILLHGVFYLYPAIDFYYGGEKFGDFFLNYQINYTNESNLEYLIFVTTFLMLIFYLFYKITFIKKEKLEPDLFIKFQNGFSVNNFRIVTIFLFTIWLLVFFYIFQRYNQSILLFFSPSRKTDLFQSAYLLALYKYIPLSILVLKIAKDIWMYQKIKISTYLLMLFPIMVYMTGGQRRELINLMIFLFLIFSQFNKDMYINYFTRIKKNRKLLIITLGTGFISIPILWWGRVIFSQLQRNELHILMPWELRGFNELIFGSSATGFKTLLLGLEHHNIFDISFGYSIYFFLLSFIPRSLIENKPIVINKLWETDLGLIGNPSTFFVNEVYINFFLIGGIFFMMIFGMFLSFIYNRWINSVNFINNIWAFIIFSNFITLFKNGFTQFFVNVLMMIIILSVPYMIIFSIKKENRAVEKSNNSIRELRL